MGVCFPPDCIQVIWNVVFFAIEDPHFAITAYLMYKCTKKKKKKRGELNEGKGGQGTEENKWKLTRI